MASELTTLVNAEISRLMKLIEPRLSALGYSPAKKYHWVKERQHSAIFVILQRQGSTYGGPTSASISLDVSAGVRVFNSDFPALALNGPQSGRAERSDGLKFHTRFNARSGSQFERTCEDIVRFVSEIVEPWSNTNADEGRLLDSDALLTTEEQENLKAAVVGESDGERVARSRKLLGLSTRTA